MLATDRDLRSRSALIGCGVSAFCPAGTPSGTSWPAALSPQQYGYPSTDNPHVVFASMVKLAKRIPREVNVVVIPGTESAATDSTTGPTVLGNRTRVFVVPSAPVVPVALVTPPVSTLNRTFTPGV